MSNDHHSLDDFFGLKPEPPAPKESPIGRLRNRFADSRLRLLPKVLSKRERYALLVLILVIIGSIIAVPFTTISHFTRPAPEYGGTLIEGSVGQPRRINPLLSQANDADRDLVSLIYSGLLQYNEEGKLVPDLAKSYEVSSDGLNYTIYLKENATWHDTKPVTADDIVYTIQTAQNQDYGSLQRLNWQGVEIQKVNDTTVIFKLKNKYAQFPNNLTLSILPKHIWEPVKPINFPLSDLNLKPIGSGPYAFKKYQKDDLGQIQWYELTANEQYYDGRSYIDTVQIRFYPSEDDMIAAYNRNEIKNLSYVSPQNLKKLKFKQRLDIRQVKLPRYFGVFFNQSQGLVIGNKNVRLALNHATDKQALVDTILAGRGSPVYSPLIETVLDVGSDIPKYQYDPEQAKKILAADGWAEPDLPTGQAGEKGILKKKNTRLTVRLTTSTFPELAQVANLLKEQWAKIGVEVTVDALPTPQLQQVIKDRGYEALLFGEILNLDPDPFSLWHSSQKNDPGLNLALYGNKTADGLLEDARQSLSPIERIKKYSDFQKLVIDDAAAVFLYNPLYLYPQTDDLKGFKTEIISMPSDRFSSIEKWYLNTRRIWKNEAE